MINFGVVFYLIGILLLGLAGAMLIPALFDIFLFEQFNHVSFSFSSMMTAVVGGTLYLSNKNEKIQKLGMREAFLLTTFAWIMLSFFSALPLFWGLKQVSMVDAVFEGVSALTTTGATVFSKVEQLPNTVLLWRAMLQWFGGTGIILVAITIFPALRIGGMQLFRSEFSDKSEKFLPRVSQIAGSIFTVYLGLTIICSLLLGAAGMKGFDAICHAMTTISTGGLSTKNNSIASFDNAAIEFIVCIFMILGSITLLLLVKLLRGDWKTIISDRQTQVFLTLIAIITTLVSWWLIYENKFHNITAWRHAFFNVTSILSSTGYMSADYASWGTFTNMIFFLICFVGGCTGSTTGGMKIFRFQVIFRVAAAQLKQLRKPLGVYVPNFNGQKITGQIVTSVLTFIGIYFLTLTCVSLMLAFQGLDFLTAISAAASSVGNIGPGIGPIIGPTESVTDLTDANKVTMMIAMILGRLEFLTVIVLLMPRFWRD